MNECQPPMPMVHGQYPQANPKAGMCVPPGLVQYSQSIPVRGVRPVASTFGSDQKRHTDEAAQFLRWLNNPWFSGPRTSEEGVSADAIKLAKKGDRFVEELQKHKDFGKARLAWKSLVRDVSLTVGVK